MRLKGKVALITGGGHGIGGGIARRFGLEGARVLVTDVDPARAAQMAGEIRAAGGEADDFTLDVREPEQVEAGIEHAVLHFGRLDILVANAGRTSRMPFLETTLEFWNEMLRLNLTGVFLAGQAAARQMVRQGDGGRIVNISSNSGIRGGRGRAAYGASKAAILNLTQTMALELAPHGILVNALCPGPTRTETVTGELPAPCFLQQMSLKRWGELDEMGRAAAFLASDDCTFTTGHMLIADGGFTATGVVEG